MATPLTKVYEAFLAKITSDEWFNSGSDEDVQHDWRMILEAALFRFKFPRVSLEIETIEETDEDDDTIITIIEQFVEDLGRAEIQLLSWYMKHEWVKRCIADWYEIKSLYTDKDFSQANHLSAMVKYDNQLVIDCAKAEGIYDRSRDGRPYDYGRLAGKRG